ncbi:glycosyltransferase [Pseudonocardia phyllosphaerae]|uniref:glycosyltransferase n=1 Tax=Pseudonocardia phyllosphaerae TaxID=3390502 RepID=UPI00397A9B2D
MVVPLRIAVLGLNYEPEPTGIAPYTSNMVRFLGDAGHDVHVLTGFPHYPWWRIPDGYTGLRRHETDGAATVTRLRHPVPSNPTGASRILAEAAFAAHTATALPARLDVVVAISPALLTVAAGLLRRRSGQTALGVVVQDLYGRALAETGVMGGRAARAATTLERALLSRADGVVAIHDTFRESMVELGVDPSRISIIPNWTHARPATSGRAETRARLGWDENETIALHAGNIGAKQGLESVVEAARLAQAAGRNVRYVLLGDGNQRAALEELAIGCDRVSFVDPLPKDEFPDTLAAADVLVLNELPGIAEMCVPSKLTSYFAAGRPVVAATDERSAAATEIALSGGGVRTEPGDPAALLRTTLELASDPAVALGFGERGRAYARSVLAEDAARSRYLAWVERLAASRATRAAGEAVSTAI